ncbi:AI-2E family transporter [Micromonospora sp. DR5-3]|uniref:AI-2E family transporter n=1 Tax=unclassified Micromonospora TaxID=2617518 RepID=UPI0011D4BC98|nr:MULTISPECIES: AI-2E family transporter [unclassified Micromonospora]MCW3818108.1 AI-2E family transporter [Micromonospora sp. DR5-3]TYC22288.1 AI-2E family transporter [Micromonospora sp. MP36]
MSNADDRSTARRTLIVIGLVLATLAALALIRATRQVLILIAVAAFFAVALKPLVDRLERRFVRRRALATLLVFVAAFVLLAALLAAIVLPLVQEVSRFAERAPELLRETKAGQGPVGKLLNRFHVLQYVTSHAGQLEQYASRLGQPVLGVLRGVVETFAGVALVVVLAYLMVLEAPKIIRATLALAGDRHAERLRRIGRESSRTITGYISGNLLISVLLGGMTFVLLLLTGVPFAAVIALLVALADLIPLVGATIGAILAIGAGFLKSPTTGVVVLVFFILYQQAENHFLAPVIMARAVRLNPLTVLVSGLLAAELAGLLGALLAIPVAGIVQILLREFVPAGRRTLPAPANGTDSAPPGASGSAGRRTAGTDGTTGRPPGGQDAGKDRPD